MSMSTPAASTPRPDRPAGPPFVRFRDDDVQPPTPLYLGRDDRLLLRVRNSLAAVVVEVRIRLQDAKGQIAPQLWTLTPSTDRSVSTANFDLAEGYLLAATVTVSGGTPRRGQTFVELSLVRGGTLADQPAELLISDYATTAALLGWPGGILRQSVEGPGMLRSVAGSDPAAGVEVVETVPTDARWRLRGFRVALVTDATVPARRVHLVIDDAAVTLLELAAADTQAASLTRNYNSAPDGFARAGADNELYVPLPEEPMLFQGWRVRTATTALAAGDNFGAPRLYVEEWIED